MGPLKEGEIPSLQNRGSSPALLIAQGEIPKPGLGAYGPTAVYS